MANISTHPHINSHDIANANESKDTSQNKSGCRLNRDVLEVIFYHLRTTIDPKNKSVLFRAALTCKAFMEPALDSLWWSMSSLMPVLKLLPNFRLVEGTRNTYTFCGKFSDQDFPRFDYYSRRVREFRHDTAPAQEISTTALIRLSRYRPIIYPHLQKVVWTAPLSPSVMLLVSPTLTGLDVQNNPDDLSIMMTLISAILSDLPKTLTAITLRGSISTTCLALVPKLTSLSTVIIPDHGVSGSATFLDQFGTLEGLENLHINLQSLATHPDHIGFPAFRTLRISGQLELIYNFVAAVTSKQIVSISVSSQSTGKLNIPQSAFERKSRILQPKMYCLGFPDLLSLIATRWPRLSRLEFDLPNISENRSITPYGLLELIRDCSLIESLSFRGFPRIPCPDQDLIDIGSILPNARVISIPFSPIPFSFTLKGPKILGLRSLAQSCRDLTSLQLSIDTRNLPTLASEPLTHGLKTLSVGDSPIEDEFLVADHLYCLFPYLSEIVSAPNPVEHRGWKLVEKILHSRQAARRIDDERRRVERLARI